MNVLLAVLWLATHPAAGFAGDEPCAVITADADYDERPATVETVGVCIAFGDSADDDGGDVFARAWGAMR